MSCHNLIYTLPSQEYSQQISDYRMEHFQHGEMELHGAVCLEKFANPLEWIEFVTELQIDQPRSDGWMPAVTMLVLDASRENRLIGAINIRLKLNDFLRECGGTIGYGVRPSERGQGFATQILADSIKIAQDYGMFEIYLSCKKVNKASQKVIKKNGGIWQHDAKFPDGTPLHMYLIQFSPKKSPITS